MDPMTWWKKSSSHFGLLSLDVMSLNLFPPHLAHKIKLLSHKCLLLSCDYIFLSLSFLFSIWSKQWTKCNYCKTNTSKTWAFNVINIFFYFSAYKKFTDYSGNKYDLRLSWTRTPKGGINFSYTAERTQVNIKHEHTDWLRRCTALAEHDIFIWMICLCLSCQINSIAITHQHHT